MTSTPSRSKVPTVNLYGENGIAVFLSEHHDLCEASDAVVRVVGRAIYGGMTLDQCHDSIRASYLAKIGVADPLALSF